MYLKDCPVSHMMNIGSIQKISYTIIEQSILTITETLYYRVRNFPLFIYHHSKDYPQPIVNKFLSSY